MPVLPPMMNRWITILFILLLNTVSGQIKGQVIDSLTGKPLAYVNIWLKGATIGTSTDDQGYFEMDKNSENDTLIVSYLGYNSLEFPAQPFLEIKLSEGYQQLEEVTIVPMKLESERIIRSYKKLNENRNYLSSGKGFQYSIGKYYPYSTEYSSTPFIKQINLVTASIIDAPIKIGIVEANAEGEPSNRYLLRNKIVDLTMGLQETKINLLDEKIRFPASGMFLVIDRVYSDENKMYNKNYEKNPNLIEYTYQPTIGMTTDGNKSATWWFYGGEWHSHEELEKTFSFEFSNVAVNLVLTD